jgi:hypothetical protein
MPHYRRSEGVRARIATVISVHPAAKSVRPKIAQLRIAIPQQE